MTPTGGSHGTLHRTAGIAGRTRRRGSVAADGARAAGGLFDMPSHWPVSLGVRIPEVSRLENVAKAGYFASDRELTMKANHRALTSTVRYSGDHHFRCWPFAFALAVAMVVALFHDLPALAGAGGSGPIPVVAIASSASAPIQAPDGQTPGHGCHCLCHITGQSAFSPVVISVVFNGSLDPPCNGAPTRSWAGLPPFRPPRV
jgi:hypothetical protein